ncbi:glycosyltransferase [Alistipes finegoldii]|jgi:glycosyltransferase involved in cell wall biosynthesis|uniref:glycosyltransferase n=3 Tax=cellular organisms TaxID=131567 RepID=UPI0015BB79B9
MKICVFGTRGFPMIQGGVEKHCESLYPRFPAEYRFVVFRRKPYVRDTPSYPNITFTDLPSTRIKGFEAVYHSFLATCRTILCRPDIVHIHNIGPALFSPVLRLCGLKIVLTYHSPNYEHKKWGRAARTLLKWSEKIALRMSDAIIFVNKFQMEKYDARIKRKSHYIPNGIPDSLPATRQDYIQELGLTPGKYVLSVGRITPEKGFDCLTRAFARLNTDYKLVIAGGVETESAYLNDLKSVLPQKKIVFTGYVYGEKLNQLYTYAGLYVLPSYNEGFPLVLLEAMSYGLDVLVSDIPATHLVDLPADDYFGKGDDKELAEKMNSRLQHPQRRVYELTPYNWTSIVKRLAAVYNELSGPGDVS